MIVEILKKEDIIRYGLDPDRAAVLIIRNINGNRTEIGRWNIYNGILAKPKKSKKAWKNTAMVLPLSTGQLSPTELEEYKQYSYSSTQMDINKTQKILTYHPAGAEHAIASATAAIIMLSVFDPNNIKPPIEVMNYPPEEAEKIHNTVLRASENWNLKISKYSKEIIAHPIEFIKEINIYKYNPRKLFAQVLPSEDLNELPTTDYTLDPRINEIGTTYKDLREYLTAQIERALREPPTVEEQVLLDTNPRILMKTTTIEKDSAPEEMKAILRNIALITIKTGGVIYKNALKLPALPQNTELIDYLKSHRGVLDALGIRTISASQEKHGLTIIHEVARVMLDTYPRSRQREIEIFALPLPPKEGAYICIRDTTVQTDEEATETKLCGFVPMKTSVREHKHTTTITLKNQDITLRYSTTKEEGQRILNAEIKEVRA